MAFLLVSFFLIVLIALAITVFEVCFKIPKPESYAVYIGYKLLLMLNGVVIMWLLRNQELINTLLLNAR